MPTASQTRGGQTPRRSGPMLLGSDLKPAKGTPPMALAALPAWLARLETLNIEGLKQEWARRFASPVPEIRSRQVLRHLIAWRVQAQTLGAPDTETLRQVRTLMADRSDGKPLKPKARLRLAPGTRLSREWKGRTHQVTVEAKGFTYEDARYESLSEIARLITGTRWSGPRLFGLEGDTR